MHVPHFRIPRMVDPRRHHEVRQWAEAERLASEQAPTSPTYERVVYGMLGIAAIIVVAAVLLRVL